MALTNDYSLELPDRSYTIGLDGDDVQVRLTPGTPGIAGVLGTPEVRQDTLVRPGEDGDVPSIDTYAPRLITANCQIVAADASSAGSAAQSLRNAFRKSRDTEEPLDVRLPGFPETTLRYYGRPLGAEEQDYLLPFGAGFWMVSFMAHDPRAYGAEVTLTGKSALFELTNAGDEATDRATFTLTADGGGAPSISHEDGRAITWKSNLSGSTVRVVDLHTGEVTDNAGVSKDSEVSWSEWPTLESGAQDITPTNCSVDVTWRPAWL